jgi:pectate lyase
MIRGSAVAHVWSLLFIAKATAGVVWMPAFPGAEGFGARTVGGRGGAVIEVTNLNDSGPGSLRAAIDAPGPRTVVFRVGGTIELQSSLVLFNPYITIAGQTAPGGIALKIPDFFNRYQDPSAVLDIRTHDVILRHLRIRPGRTAPGTSGGEIDCIQIYGPAHNLMIDHCSLSWAVDENFSSWGATQYWTMQWCIVSEGLLNAGHSEGPHSMGILVGSEGSQRISLHHNLTAHDKDRNPRIKTTGIVDFVNNVAYNYGEFIGLLSSDYASPPFNYVGNYVRSGPSSESTYELQMWEMSGNTCSAYVEGNIGPHRTQDTQPNINVVDPDDRQYVVTTRYDAVPVLTDSAVDAYARVLAEAGATLPSRDAADARIVNDVLNNTGGIIDNPAQVGGWPTLIGGTPPADADHDGMPDAWEQENDLDPDSPADGPLDNDGDGYTNLEEYLNGTDPDQDPLGGVRLVGYGGASPEGATLAAAGAGRFYRTDRVYTFTSLPTAYACALTVAYPEADATNAGSEFVTLSAESPAVVAVGYDTRGAVPGWLATWASTGETVTGKESGNSGNTVTFAMRTRNLAAGETLGLGGNRAGGGTGPAGYVVLVVPSGTRPAPSITQQPQDQVIKRASTAILSAAATGGEGTLRYRWRRAGLDLSDNARYSGSATSSLTISGFTPADAGSFQVLVQGNWCSTLSAEASLIMATPCDFDHDGDVDQDDFGPFQACLGAPISMSACAATRLDGDDDTDAADLAIFQGCMSGAGHPAAARCVE